MDTISILFISIIVLLSGLTAYVADSLGRYMGKKKLTFLGIRPKYTAISFTISAGLLIPFITIAFLYYFSADVRVWLEEGQNAAIQRDRKVKELEYMITKIAKRTAEVKELEIQQSKAENNLKEAQKKISIEQAETIKVNKGLKKLKIELQNIKFNYKNLQQNLKLAQENSNHLTTKNHELLQIKSNLLKDLESKTKQTQEISLYLVQLQKDVDNLNDQKREIQQQFEETSHQLRKDIQYTQSQLTLARNEKDILLKETDQIKKGLDLNLYKTRFMSMIFKQGDELASIIVPAQSSQSLVINLIDQLKEKSQLKVKEKNTELEHVFFDKELPELYDSLTSRSFSTVLSLIVTWNSFEEETVPYAIIPSLIVDKKP